MSRLNKILLIGTIGSEIESIDHSSSLPCRSFVLDVPRPYQGSGGFAVKDSIRIIAVGDASRVVDCAKEGSTLLVEGQIHIDSKEDEIGNRTFITSVETRIISLISGTGENIQEQRPSNDGFRIETKNIDPASKFDFKSTSDADLLPENFGDDVPENIPF